MPVASVLSSALVILLSVGFSSGNISVNRTAVVLDKGEPTEEVITASAWNRAMTRIQTQNAQIKSQDLRIDAQDLQISALQSQASNLQEQVATLNATLVVLKQQVGVTCSSSDVLSLIDCFEVKETCGFYFEAGQYTIQFAGQSSMLVYCDEAGRTLMASTVSHPSAIETLDPRASTLGNAHPDEDYMMEMAMWVSLFGDGSMYDFHADIAATNKEPFRFIFFKWGIRAGDFAYKHTGGGCYQPFESDVSTCTRPQWVHNDGSDDTWQGTFGAPCCSGDYGWGGACGYGQFHGDYSGSFVYSFGTDGYYNNPPSTYVSKLSFWAVRR